MQHSAIHLHFRGDMPKLKTATAVSQPNVQVINAAAAEKILIAYRDKLQHLLTQCGGYQCQEVEGDCMLAFADAAQAVLFCLLVSSLPAASKFDLLAACMGMLVLPAEME